MEIQAFVLAKDGVVIDVFPELDLAQEEGSRLYGLELQEDEEDQQLFDLPQWVQDSDDTWSLWGEETEYTVTVR